MAALSGKVLWPIVAIFIFGVLAGFYIDDRRGLMQEGDSSNKQQASSSEHGGKTAEHKQASNEHAGESAESKEHGGKAAEKSPTNSSQSSQAAGATSLSIDEYLSESSSERSEELEANAAHHQGFSGSIDEYLSGKAKATNNVQADTSKQPKQSNQASGATSMSMDEYHAKTSGHSNSTTQQASTNTGAYHGDMDGYLAKYGDGNQTTINNSSEKPFNKKEHMGFHGSYEEYAKKYN